MNGTTQTSNVVTMRVTPAEEIDHEDTPAQEVPMLMVRLHADNTSVVLGQTIHGTLSLYYRIDNRMGNVILEHLETPQWPELAIEVDQDAEQGKEQCNGVEYAYYRWHWKVVPQRAGTTIIPGCIASCRIPIQTEDNDVFAGLNAFFGGFKQQRIASNALRIMVNDLPKSSIKPDAIGSFSAIQAHVDDNVVTQQDATTLCITITGNEAVEAYTLQEIPDALRWYDAQRTVTHNAHTKITNTAFEFVLQGMCAGTWTIPQQTFHYFDPHDRSYKKLTTDPLSITITSPAGSHQHHAQESLNKDVEQIKIAPQDAQQHDIWDTEWIAHDASHALSWPIFFVLLIMSSSVGIVYWYKNRRDAHVHTYLGKKRAIRQAKQALHTAGKSGNVSCVYAIFVQLWAYCLHKPSAHIDHEMLLASVQTVPLSSDQQEAWNAFVTRMISMAYADGTVHDEHFFKEALRWVDSIAPYL